MDIGKLQQRMNAEGITASISKIAETIVSEGNKFRTGGYTFPEELISVERLIEENKSSTKYSDSCAGWSAYIETTDNKDRQDIEPYCLVRNGEELISQKNYYEYLENKLSLAPVNAKLKIEEAYGCNKLFLTYVKLTDSNWKLTQKYSSEEAMEEDGVFLPKGIRSAVATALNISDISSTFHAAFKEAVNKLYKEHYGN